MRLLNHKKVLFLFQLIENLRADLYEIGCIYVYFSPTSNRKNRVFFILVVIGSVCMDPRKYMIALNWQCMHGSLKIHDSFKLSPNLRGGPRAVAHLVNMRDA